MHQTVTLVKSIDGAVPATGTVVFTWTYVAARFTPSLARARAFRALKRDHPDEDPANWNMQAATYSDDRRWHGGDTA